MSEDLKLRQRILTRWGTLKKEREPYMTQWLEISEHITPSRGRFLIGKNRNESRSRWNRIVDSSAVRAANILAAGLMSGMTDPSSQWFALTTGTPNLDEAQAVKVWLDQVQRIMEMAFTRTNTYQALHQGWRDVYHGSIAAVHIVPVQTISLLFIVEKAVSRVECLPQCLKIAPLVVVGHTFGYA